MRKKLEAVHAAEIGQLRKQIKELEDARAGLLRPTEHITRPLRQALASEAARRQAVEAEMAAVQQEKAGMAAALDEASAARHEASNAIEEKKKVEAKAALELHRVREFVQSHDELMEYVKEYAETLEGTLQKVEVEKEAVEARWKSLCAAEIAVAQQQNAASLASVQQSAEEASEQARAEARASELKALIAQAAAAAAEATAAAAVVTEKQMAARLESGQNDVALKQVVEARLSALELELKAHTIHYESRLSAAGQIEAAILEEAEVRSRAMESQLEACRNEVAALGEWNTAKTHEAHLSAIVQTHALQMQQGEAAANLAKAKAETKYAPRAVAVPLERALADAEARLEHARTESNARTQHAEAVLSATLDSEKEAAEANATFDEEKTLAERDGGSSKAWAVERAAEAQREARAKADEQRASAHKEYLESMLRAEHMEKHALQAQLDATVGAGSTAGLSPLKAAVARATAAAALAKANEHAPSSEQAKADAELLRKTTEARLEFKLGEAQKNLDIALKDAERSKSDAVERFEGNIQKRVAQIEKTRELQLGAVSKKLAKANHTANIKLEAAMQEANEKRDQQLEHNLRVCTEKLEEALSRQNEAAAEADKVVLVAREAADAAAIRTAANRWSMLLKAKLVSGDASSLTFGGVEGVLETLGTTIAGCQRHALEAKATAAQVSKKAAADMAAAGTTLLEVRRDANKALSEAKAAYELSQEESSKVRAQAAKQEAEVRAAIPSSMEVTRAEEEAAAAVAAERAARDAVAHAKALHDAAVAETASKLASARQAAEAARAQTTVRLDAAKEDERRLKAIQLAAEEADVARKEATEKRRLAEMDRRKAEDARLCSQHEAIGRRPGGKRVLASVQVATRK